MKLIKLSLFAFSLLAICSCDNTSSISSSTSDHITENSQNNTTSSSFVMPEHKHSSNCEIYSQDSEQENYFIYKKSNTGYEIIGISSEVDASSITELRIPLKHNGIAVTSVTNFSGQKLTSCTKLVFPEEFNTIKGINDFPNLTKIVLPRKLDKLEKCEFIEYNYKIKIEITWPEDCLNFSPPNNDNYTTINYPYNCQEIDLPESRYVYSITIYGDARKFTHGTTNYSNIREVYCLSGYLSDDYLKEKIIKLESIKRNLDIESSIKNSNGIYFYQDDKTTFPIAFEIGMDVVIFPESLHGKKYGIKSYTFYTHIPKNIVFSKEILYCEEYSFLNTHSNCFFETDENPENFAYWFWGIDGSSGSINSIDDLVNIYYKSEWGYIDGKPTPNN